MLFQQSDVFGLLHLSAKFVAVCALLLQQPAKDQTYT